jgi:predicted DNA-binding ribbon-helix-helix protein
MIAKRSVKIAGHKTSVSLEAEFWDTLKAIAAREGMSLAALIERIDAARAAAGGADNLSSALRLHVLAYLRARAGV